MVKLVLRDFLLTPISLHHLVLYRLLLLCLDKQSCDLDRLQLPLRLSFRPPILDYT